MPILRDRNGSKHGSRRSKPWHASTASKPASCRRLRDALAAELAELEAGAVSEAELQQRLAAARERYLAAAKTPRPRGGSRRPTALDRKVTGFMQALGMPGGVFTTRVEPQDPPVFSAHGNDEIEFLVSANPGQPPRPLAKVASGGELSRISLALQVAAVEAAHLPCLVFDEVDAGVGGAVAEMVGRQLHALAAKGQVLCVTHLPQVASQSDHQLRVSKHVTAARPARRSKSWMKRPASKNWPACWAGRPSPTARASTRAKCWPRRVRRAPRRRPIPRSTVDALRAFRAVRASLAHAVAVQGERVIGDLETEALGDLPLPLLDILV